MENNIFTSRSSLSKLFVLLLLLTGALYAPAQSTILIDNCNTGPFTIFGVNNINDLPATGAIGGTRDVQITNTTTGLMTLNTATGYMQVRPGGFGGGQDPFAGNYDIGWGNNDFLGGSDLNLNAANYNKIDVSLQSAPYASAIMTVRFNQSGDTDYSTASVSLHGPGNYSLPFANFGDLDAADIDGISIGFSNCYPDTVVLVQNVQISGFADTDGDGIGNGNDNCPNTANSSQADADGDGIGDACDACPNDAGNDADGDGVCGNVDNCPNSANTSQADADGDGIGDACDACPNDAGNDADGDGVCGDVDNCPATANSSQADTDGDGIGDACDVCVYALSGIQHFNTGTCDCESGYTAVIETTGEVDIITGCNIVRVSDSDSDCDGTFDTEDVCPGGDDNGPCNATSFPGFNQIPSSWICGHNNNKVQMCHYGNTICVSPNAVADHLSHGDFLGPCVSCGENRSTPIGDAGLDMATGLAMELYPNPTDGKVRIDLHGLGEAESVLTVFDQLGKVVYKQKIKAGTQQLELDFAAKKITAGEYYVRVSGSEGVVVKMLVVSSVDSK